MTRHEPLDAFTEGATADDGLGERARCVAAGVRSRSVPPRLVRDLAAIGEASAALAAGAAAVASDGPAHPAALAFPLAAALLMVVGLAAGGAYRLDALHHPQRRVGRVLATWTAAFAGAAFALYETGLAPEAGRPTWLAWYVGGAALVLAARLATAVVVRRLAKAGRLQVRAVIVGGGPSAERLLDRLAGPRGEAVHVLGIFDDRDERRSPESQAGCPKLGTVEDLRRFARVAAIDLVIVAIPPTAETRLLQLLKRLWELPVDIRIAAHESRLRLRPRSYSHIGGVPFLDVFDRPIAGWDSVAKRAFDLVFATLALVAFAPVMLAIALAIRIDSPGPVLFRQKRYGFNNEVIEVLKFRSMYHHLADPAARRVVTRDDPRVTRVGRFLRRTSLDELPQFLNVLAGDLSLVGPRPHAVAAHTGDSLWEEVVDGYFARHRVKPGVTGWAQINGWRGEADTSEKIRCRVEHDLHYIENWSVLFDLYILVLTPLRILDQDTAY